MMSRKIVLPLVGCLVLLISGSLQALSIQDFPDNSPVRVQVVNELYQGMSRSTTVKKSRVISHPLGRASVQFQVTLEKNELFFMFINQYKEKYPLFSPGNYFIQGTASTGALESVKIMLQEDNLSFVTVFNTKPHPRLEVKIMGMDMVKNVRVPMSFHEVLTLPFSTLVQRTSAGVDWKTVFSKNIEATWPVRDLSNSLETIVGAAGLVEVEDGGMNEKGEFVTIHDGIPLNQRGFNCSGFVKWVIDGLVYPYQRSWLSIERLKRRWVLDRGHSFSSPYEEVRDPFFGLDWTRNLALKVMSLDDPHRKIEASSADVRDIPYLSYFENRGYNLDNLPFILWWMAVNRPGMALLGSVNGEWGKEPVLNQHHHVTLLLPWFDENGIFHYSVQEIVGTSSFASLKRRYPRQYIHLVQIPVRETPVFPSLLP